MRGYRGCGKWRRRGNQSGRAFRGACGCSGGKVQFSLELRILRALASIAGISEHDMSTTSRLVGGICALITLGAALAEETRIGTRYLVPATYQPSLDAPLSLRFELSNAPAGPASWPADEMRWLF